MKIYKKTLLVFGVVLVSGNVWGAGKDDFANPMSVQRFKHLRSTFLHEKAKRANSSSGIGSPALIRRADHIASVQVQTPKPTSSPKQISPERQHLTALAWLRTPWHTQPAPHNGIAGRYWE